MSIHKHTHTHTHTHRQTHTHTHTHTYICVCVCVCVCVSKNKTMKIDDKCLIELIGSRRNKVQVHWSGRISYIHKILHKTLIKYHNDREYDATNKMAFTH